MKSIVHPLIALVVQIVLGLATGNWWYGVAASALYIGRENAQAEYRWIERYGSHLRANMPWWGAFDPKVWTLRDLAGWLLPLAVTLLVALVLA